MTFPHDVQSAKIFGEYYQPLIDGEKPFEIRIDDGEHVYEEGEKLLLREIKYEVEIPGCPFPEDCPDIKKALLGTDGKRNEKEDSSCCPFSRVTCGPCQLTHYTGRWCLVKIKKVYRLDTMRLLPYVAFTFDILDKGKENESYLCKSL